MSRATALTDYILRHFHSATYEPSSARCGTPAKGQRRANTVGVSPGICTRSTAPSVDGHSPQPSPGRGTTLWAEVLAIQRCCIAHLRAQTPRPGPPYKCAWQLPRGLGDAYSQHHAGEAGGADHRAQQRHATSPKHTDNSTDYGPQATAQWEGRSPACYDASVAAAHASTLLCIIVFVMLSVL